MKKILTALFALILILFSINAMAFDPNDIPQSVKDVLGSKLSIDQKIDQLNKLADIIVVNDETKNQREWALYFQATIYTDLDNWDQAYPLFVILAEEFKNADAHEIIGDIHYFGKGHFTVDYNKAGEWYRKYVELEQDPDIIVRHASLMATGEGGYQKDPIRAWYWFYLAYNDKGYLPGYFGAHKLFLDMRELDQFKVEEFLNTGSTSSLFLLHEISK